MSEENNQNSSQTALVPQQKSTQQLQQTIQQNIPTISLDEIEKLSIHFKASALYGITPSDQAKCIVKMLAGRELGIGPWTSVKEIYISKNGKLAFPVSLQMSLLKKSGKYKYTVKEATDQVASIDFYEYGEFVGNAKFTIEQAKTAGLLSRDTYKEYPDDMLFNRAMGRGIRRFCPDILCGNLYTPEEMREIEEKEESLNNNNTITIETTETKEDSAKKENFIQSIAKMDQVLLELGEPVIEENLSQLNLSQLKQTVDKKVIRMKQALIDKLVIGIENPKELVEQLNKENVMDLYKMYKKLPTP